MSASTKEVASQTPVGAALVVGGGVGGMQAALDLAECGIKVYLVDKQPCIGGTMAQLDKTFPTNDCSMCIVAPRLVDVGRHRNIEVVANAEVEALAGDAGRFEVTVRRRGRFIDVSRCTGCGACTEVCPVTVNAEFDLGLSQRKAIYKRYPQAVPGAYAIDKQGKPACTLACPASVNACGYVTLLARGQFKEALDLERQGNPLPAICGRVCPHPCEQDCQRGTLDHPVAIAHLKRFLADWEMTQPYEPPPRPAVTLPERVAVVGSGPGGLTCALDLRRQGYQVTIFEAAGQPGGMLDCAIPAYRLPRDIVQREIAWILDHGIELKLRAPVGAPGRTIDDLFKSGFQAVFLATGAHKGVKLMLDGEAEYAGIVDALAYLREYNLSGHARPGQNVLVVGGGNSAIDSARTALRLGAEQVTVVYRRSRREMPANAWEIEEAEREGVQFYYLAGPTRIIGQDGKLTALRCIRMELGEPDQSGRRRPLPVPGSDFDIAADLVIAAVSQEADLSYLPKDGRFRTSRWGTLEVDPVTLQTSVPGVFAGGDCVAGPASVIEAVAAAKEAAISIGRLLRGEDLKTGRARAKTQRAEKDLAELEPLERVAMPMLPLPERQGNFREVETGYTKEQAVAEASRCVQCATCCECRLCLKACEAKAIDHDMAHERRERLEVGAVVLAPGFALFDATAKQEFGYGRFPNVVSSLEFERILSASGPFSGKILRPGDREHPKKIAFIQCVGSRDEERNYCSSVCCMYATKEAIIAKEHEPDLDLHIFFIDMRAFGKGFDEYYERAKKEGIKYTRCRPSSVRELPNGDLSVRYQDEAGAFQDETFSLVVLSCGLRPPADVDAFARTVGLQLNQHGFCHTEEFRPVETSRPGVFVCGPFTEPKDIPETVMQASGAAGKAMALLATVRGTLVKKREFPPEVDVRGQEPRVGVFVCHCGKNIGGVADVPAIAEYAKTLPDVVHADHFLYSCSNDSQERIQAAIKEHRLNRVVVAACTPRTHEPLFQASLREAGLNPYLFDFANIRDQCTWVHMHLPEAATAKAKDLVRMSVAKARLLEPLYRKVLDINHDAVVVGGGLAGMTAALELAEQGFVTHLIERERELGGNLRRTRFLLSGEDPQEYLKDLVARVNRHHNLKLYLGAQVTAVEGFFGNFQTTVRTVGNGQAETKIKHGAIVVATGAGEHIPTEYLYGQNDRVLTARELEQRIADGQLEGLDHVVMIQCVGSRDQERPFCSRICCQQAVKNAIRLKEKKPAAAVFVLYRDVRMYGFLEEHYQKARKLGVVFLRYEAEHKPKVEAGADGRLVVTVPDSILGADLEITTDRVALSAAIVPRPDAKDLAQQLKVPLNQNGFFLEAHLKLRPVDFATDGIYLCGLAHAPKTAAESIAQACGAAGRAGTILARDTIELDAALSEPNDETCDGCAYCIDPCPYHAVTLLEYQWLGDTKKVVEVDEAKCKGCGVCMATCPKKAIMVRHFKLDQLAAMVEAALLPT